MATEAGGVVADLTTAERLRLKMVTEIGGGADPLDTLLDLVAEEVDRLEARIKDAYHRARVDGPMRYG